MKPKKFLMIFILSCLTGCTFDSNPSNGGMTDIPKTDLLTANNPCENNLAADLYPCSNLSLYAHLTPIDLGGQQVNDIWG